MISITVCYATPEKQVEIALDIDENCTVADAITQSKIIEQFPEINLSDNAVGIFYKCATLNTIVQEGDRVEIYRRLTVDPKDARRTKSQLRSNIHNTIISKIDQ